MAGRSCSTCSAISTRCRLPAARRSGSWAGCRSRASQPGRRMARPSRSSPTAAASRTCGSPTPMARTRARSAGRRATISRKSWCRRRGRRTSNYIVVSKVTAAGPRHLLAVHVSPRRRHGCSRWRRPRHGRPGGAGPPPARHQQDGRGGVGDGRFIYYTQRTGTFTYNALLLWQIYRRYRDRRRHADHRPQAAPSYSLSPDGKWMVYGTRHKSQTACASAISRLAWNGGSPIR